MEPFFFMRTKFSFLLHFRLNKFMIQRELAILLPEALLDTWQKQKMFPLRI